MNQSLPLTSDKSSSKDQARIHTTETGASYQAIMGPKKDSYSPILCNVL